MSLLLEKLSPGATTCILIGSAAGLDATRLRGCQHLLWWAEATLPPTRFLIPAERLAPGTPGSEALLERFLRRDHRHLPSLFVGVGGDAPAYQPVIALVHDTLEQAHRARLTRQRDGFTWQKHLLANTPAYLRHRLPDAWTGALRSLPAFVCGAGPSLDVSIAKLAAHADRAVIFAADSALRALARHGVTADFVVSIDAAKVPEKCLPETHRPTRAVLASVSPPGWPAALGSTPYVFLSGNQVTDSWLATQGAPRTAIGVTESCGSTAIELAHHLGCAPICLFGLDLAVDPARQARRHQQDADPSLYSNSNYDPTATLPRVPGNYADTVPCFALGDWRQLDARLATRTDRRYYNITDRGARLSGCTVIHPDAFSLDAPSGAKLPLLAALPSGTPADPAVLAKIHALGARCAQSLPTLHQALAQSGPAALAEAFRPLLRDPDTARVLGAYALKLMPHLMPPTEGDTALWQGLLEEFAELCALLQKPASPAQG